ncbi:hypothetical protein AGMMS49574_28490 [Bacteroidia bacterium]|nr:hypothetical protein AGMMS49574_28490 [Bacteroidia bacterium]
MRKKINILLLFLLSSVLPILSVAQTLRTVGGDVKDYKRSSLYLILLDDPEWKGNPKADIIRETFAQTPLPDKFNDHNLDIRSINPSAFLPVSDEFVTQVTGKPYKRQEYTPGVVEYFDKISKESGTARMVDTLRREEIPAMVAKHFESDNTSLQILGKWFNLKDAFDEETQSHFDVELVKERGLYGATQEQITEADKHARGRQMLGDLGEDLISKTFVVALRMIFCSKEDMAKQAQALAGSVMGGLLGKDTTSATYGFLSQLATNTSTTLMKGYVVETLAYLYQLEWNDETSLNFYKNYYNLKDLSTFRESKDFHLKYLGTERELAQVSANVYSFQNDENMLKRATVRAMDEVIAKLQKRFEPFRTTTPLYTAEGDNISAKIGMKEGLKGGEKFEVLEETFDPETLKSTFKRVAVIKVDKQRVWDNRFGADEDRTFLAAHPEEATKEKKKASYEGTATYFTGGNKKIYPGMFIRQID